MSTPPASGWGRSDYLVAALLYVAMGALILGVWLL